MPGLSRRRRARGADGREAAGLLGRPPPLERAGTRQPEEGFNRTVTRDAPASEPEPAAATARLDKEDLNQGPGKRKEARTATPGAKPGTVISWR